MKKLSFVKLLVFSLVLALSASVCEAQTFDRPPAPKQQKSASRKPLKQKKTKVKGPKAAMKAQKAADKKEKKQDKDYAKFLKYNQKRSIEIQTPEVKARMKQNIKDANASYKAKKKSNSTRTRKAGKKYR
jgi:hypothetical protein